MRQPRPSDVLEAVEYVTGADVFASRGTRDQAMTLACHALAEICELSRSASGRVLHVDRTTVRYHLTKPIDLKAVSMVIQRVNDRIEAEDFETGRARAERRAIREEYA